MYSYEDRIRAVKLYIKLGKRTGPTIRQLGYASMMKFEPTHRIGKIRLLPNEVARPQLAVSCIKA